MTEQVVGDKKLQKALTNYVVEEKRDLLCVTIFDGNAELCSSPEIAKLLEKEPDLMSSLMKLFEEKAKRDVEEKGKPNIVKSDSLQTKLELKSTRPLTLPPLFAPFKDEKKGWTKSNVAEQVTLYINLLGYGIGGDKTFVSSTKHKDSSKPEWFPDSISYENYTHPSKAKITENEDVIDSIFKHHGLDIKTHVVEAGIETKKRKSLANSSILEDRVIIGLGLPKDKTEEQNEDFDFKDFVADVKRTQATAGSSGTIPKNGPKKPLNQKRTGGPVAAVGGQAPGSKKQKKTANGDQKCDYEILREQNIAEREALERELGYKK